MTWNDLFSLLSDSQRNTDCTIMDSNGEFFRADLAVADFDDILDKGHPFLVGENND